MKLSLPEFVPSRTSRERFSVRFCETDLMGIVHHANYLQYFEMGRVGWMKERGISYDVWLAEGAHLPVVDAQLHYAKAARFDDVLDLDTACLETTRVTVRFGYRLFRGDDVLCEGVTLLACVSDAMTPRRFPDRLGAVLRGEIR
jgi:acyl-CoA thioester hydrolase